MSFAQIKEQVFELSQEQRDELAALLLYLSEANDPEYLAELDRRMDRMDRGEKVSEAEVRALHQKLCDEGR